VSALALCIAIAIADGDTLTVRCGAPGAYTQTKIRIAEIDAPERRQAYGERAHQTLATLCHQQTAEVTPQTLDRYGRTVARVRCQGQDVSAAMVKAGMAWAYAKYLTDPEIKRLEGLSRTGKVGLWSDTAPVPPWEYRHRKVGE
jgi:endonuclease YncB( thermonuclease family)